MYYFYFIFNHFLFCFSLKITSNIITSRFVTFRGWIKCAESVEDGSAMFHLPPQARYCAHWADPMRSSRCTTSVSGSMLLPLCRPDLTE